MIDVYIGVVGEPDSVLTFEFDDFAEASQFCDNMVAHFKEEKKRLYLALDNTEEFESMEEVYKDEQRQGVEIDVDVFREILELQAQEEVRYSNVHRIIGVDDVGTCRRI